MSSFFGKLRGNNASGGLSTSSSTKRDSAFSPHQTPLTKLLESAGPLRADGSDKYFGLENFGNTCYCNSILQCLYYSVPFRERVIEYPVRASPEMLRSKVSKTPVKLNVNNGTIGPATVTLAPRPPPVPGSPIIRPEDKPDTPEYKKKHAMLNGPIVMMDYEHSASYGMSESLFTSLKDIFEAIVAHPSRHGVVAPHKFLENLKNKDEMFRTSMHQDAHEFLNLLLNDVVTNVEENTRKAVEGSRGSATGDGFTQSLDHMMAYAGAGNAVETAGKPGWVHELFEGTLTSETKCLTCENVSQRDEAFLDLSVDLDQHSSVTSCLNQFSEEEMLCERNKFHCDKCGGLQEAEKRMKIKRLPRILALHLKRFKYTEDQQRLQKLFHRVKYPYHLRLSNTTDDAEDPDRLYELYAVVVHIGGGPYHGHYVAIVKTEDRGWLLFDDEMVEPVDKSYVQNFFGDKPGLACAYVLFYQETTIEAVRREQESEGLEPTTVALGAKEGHPIRVNGNANVPNGALHHVHTVNTPMVGEAESLTSLSHAVTAPSKTPAVASHAVPAAPEPTPRSPSSPLLGSRKSDARLKKEKAEEEKRQKHAEKEKEKAEKAKSKSLDLMRKDQDKRRREEAKAAFAASSHTKADEDARLAPSHGDGHVGKENGHGPVGGVIGGSLSRFRKTSKSLSRKPFWKHEKDKEEGLRAGGEKSTETPHTAPSESEQHSGPDGYVLQQQSPQRHQQPPPPRLLHTQKPLPMPPVPPISPEKYEKPKSHRFSLKKKMSSTFS